MAVGPAAIFLGMVVVVTVIALVRANRDDVPRIFAAFASAFGFRVVVGGEGSDADEADKSSGEGEASKELGA